jgi:hypothetical protein
MENEKVYIQLIFNRPNIEDHVCKDKYNYYKDEMKNYINDSIFKNYSCKILYYKNEMYFKIKDDRNTIILKDILNFISSWISNTLIKINNIKKSGIYQYGNEEYNNIYGIINLIINDNVYFTYNIENDIKIQRLETLIGILKDIVNVEKNE